MMKINRVIVFTLLIKSFVFASTTDFPVRYPYEFVEVDGLPRSIELADFDQDGYLDAVVGNYGTDVFVLMNVNGAFADPLVFTMPHRRAVDVATADIDSDGDKDIIIANSRAAATPPEYPVTILVNQGGGQFTERYLGSQDQSASLVAAADMDNDGDTDLLVSVGSYRFDIYSNDGNGVFEVDSYIQFSQPATAIAVADLNNDSLVDVVIGHDQVRPGGLTVHFNQGMLQFQRIGIDCPRVTRTIVCADLDQDGLNDIAVGGYGGFNIHYNIDGASFEPYVSCCFGNSADLDLVDLDGDGDLDMVSPSDGHIKLLENLSNREFGNEVLLPRMGGQHLVVGDIDRDEKLDLMISSNDRRVIVVRGQDQWQWFTSEYVGGSPVLLGPLSFSMGDWDSDGSTDVAISGEEGHVSVRFDIGNEIATRLDSYQLGESLISMGAADLDGDADLDLVGLQLGVSGGPRKVVILENDTEGVFALRQGIELDRLAERVSIIDLDNDGDEDLVCSLQLSIHRDDGVLVLWNDGSGHFDLLRSLSLPPSWGNAFGDFDRDGDMDFAGISRADGMYKVQAHWQVGGVQFEGQLVEQVSQGGQSTPVRVQSSDLNDDGQIDLAVLFEDVNSLKPGFLRVYFQEYSKSFSFQGEYALPNEPADMRIADINSDGHADIVVVNNEGKSVSVLINLANGQFMSHLSFYVSGFPDQVELCDFDGDQRPELIVNSGLDSGLNLLRSLPGVSCRPDLNKDGALSFYDVSAFIVAYLTGSSDADFNSDGILDATDIIAFISAFNAGCP